MVSVNENFIKLPGNYLFSEVAKRVSAFKASHPEVRLIRLGIGDVTRPLPQASVEAMHRAVDEMAHAESFHGYGPEQGYDFLREAIVRHDFGELGIGLSADEIFVSDGAKSDSGNIGDIFSQDNKIAVCDPVYPVVAYCNPVNRIVRVVHIHRSSNGRLPCREDILFLTVVCSLYKNPIYRSGLLFCL